MQYGGAEGPASSWALELVSAFWETGTSAEGRCAGVDSHGAPQIMNIVSAKRVVILSSLVAGASSRHLD